VKIRMIIAVAVLLVGCGSDDNTHQPGSPGDSCQPSVQGAATCQSKVCATVTCVNSVTNASNNVSVCTGSKCTSVSDCPTSNQCVTSPSSGSWCVPQSVCN
jgi:hypothetical protein